MGNFWANEDTHKSFEEMFEKRRFRLLWGYTKEEREELEKNKQSVRWNIKYAQVKIADKPHTVMVDTRDMKAYKLRGPEYGYEVTYPLEEIEYDEFIMWHTSMSL